jgi:hypothetical protein
MPKRWFEVLILLTALLLVSPTLHADHGDKGNKHGKSDKHFDDDGDQGWERRDGYEYHSYGNTDVRPAGWNKGKKTGWKNCGLPPGQAKKYGCRTYVYEGRPHYYYEDDRGQIIVRRPLVEIHGNIDIR